VFGLINERIVVGVVQNVDNLDFVTASGGITVMVVSVLLVTFLLFGVAFDDQSLAVHVFIFADEWNAFKPCKIEELMLILRNNDFTLGNLLDLALHHHVS
jgi:hypothetical protein